MSLTVLTILITLIIVAAISTTLCVYLVIRLSKYITNNVEEAIEEQIERVDNLSGTMERALREDMFKDGTLRQQMIRKNDYQ